jgi:FKBP-type peptidyl-prolyl cis-trans isomerase FkpA
MKQKFFSIVTLAIVLSSCIKQRDGGCGYTEQNIVAPAAEVSALEGWISANVPTAIKHSSGLFYIINNAGTGATPNVCSGVTVKYTGTLLNGSQFDQSTTGVSFVLGQLIQGWQKGIPLIKSGGSITLYIPPSLGYGAQEQRDRNGNISIPANSNLKFIIDLTAVQ